MGLVAAGVNAIKLAEDDAVAGMVELAGKGDVALIANNGMAWRIEQEGFPIQGRYGQGVIGCRLGENVAIVGVAFGKKNFQFTLHFKKAAAKTYRLDDIPLTKRAGKGDLFVQLSTNDQIERIAQQTEPVE